MVSKIKTPNKMQNTQDVITLSIPEIITASEFIRRWRDGTPSQTPSLGVILTISNIKVEERINVTEIDSQLQRVLFLNVTLSDISIGKCQTEEITFQNSTIGSLGFGGTKLGGIWISDTRVRYMSFILSTVRDFTIVNRSIVGDIRIKTSNINKIVLAVDSTAGYLVMHNWSKIAS